MYGNIIQSPKKNELYSYEMTWKDQTVEKVSQENNPIMQNKYIQTPTHRKRTKIHPKLTVETGI